jgi:hypothetical protein
MVFSGAAFFMFFRPGFSLSLCSGRRGVFEAGVFRVLPQSAVPSFRVRHFMVFSKKGGAGRSDPCFPGIRQASYSFDFTDLDF